MRADPQDRLLALLDRVSDLNRELREHIAEGRLDRLDPVLQERENCLRELADSGAMDAELSAETTRRIDSLRIEGQELREWLQGEKDEVASALASLRSQRVDPFREQLVGATVLDRRA